MARLRRFENHRYVGTRDDMVAYDCDDTSQFGTLAARVEVDDLMNRDLLQAFGPDEVSEARNRGFRLARI
jgi:hypothetical protein